MKKIFYVILTLLIFVSCANAVNRRVLKLGILTKLNSTEEQFSEIWKKTFAPNNENLEIIVRFYDSLMAMQMALNAGEVQEIVLPEESAEYLINQNPNYEATLVLKTKGMGLSFGFREDRSELLKKFNDALMSLKGNWTLGVLEGIYIASPGVDDPEPVKFEKFEGAETIRVAVTGDLPPIDFMAADGTPAGFNTAVLSEVGSYLHQNIELVSVEAGARTASLASGRADVVFWYEVDTSSTIQPDVPEGIILSDPYYEWNKFIHVRKKIRQSKDSGWSFNDIKNGILDFYLAR